MEWLTPKIMEIVLLESWTDPSQISKKKLASKYSAYSFNNSPLKISFENEFSKQLSTQLKKNISSH